MFTSFWLAPSRARELCGKHHRYFVGTSRNVTALARIAKPERSRRPCVAVEQPTETLLPTYSTDSPGRTLTLNRRPRPTAHRRHELDRIRERLTATDAAPDASRYPMRLLRIPEPFDHPAFLFETKLDGFRALPTMRVDNTGAAACRSLGDRLFEAAPARSTRERR
jgi:hypothetical protein